MTEQESIQQLRAVPRDTTVVVERNPKLADALGRDGYQVLHVAPTASVEQTHLAAHVPDCQYLADNWSALSCRSSSAVCIGTKPLGRAVEYLTVRAHINGNTARYRSRGWCENLLANFHMLLEPTFGAYAGALDGVPAFIVGAGASLDEDLKEIRKLHDRGIVIAINGAARVLQTGIALTVEGNDVTHKLGPLGPEIVRAFSLFADPAVTAHGEGPAMPVFTGALAAIPEWLTGYQRLACSGLGGTAAFSLAERLGCSPIVLVGHEFCLKDGGRIYPECLGIGESRAHLVQGETEQHWKFDWDETAKQQKRQNPLNEEDQLVILKNAAGEDVFSTRAFAAASTWFEQAASKTETKCIQATAGGAVLKGWTSMPLADVVRALPNRPYELSPNENGLSPGVLLAWLEKQMLATSAAIDAGQKLHADPSEAAIAALRKAMLAAPLVEPWCHAAVTEVAEARRESAPSRNRYQERKAALQHARWVGWAIATEAPKLLEGLVVAATRIREAGGSELQDCCMPPGAADDLLRCALRSMAPYQNLSRFRKAVSWATA